MRWHLASIAAMLLVGCGDSSGPTKSQTESPNGSEPTQPLSTPGSRYVAHRLLQVGAEADLTEAGQVLEVIDFSSEGSLAYDAATGAIRCTRGGAGCVRVRYRDDVTQNSVQTQCFVCIDQTGDCGGAPRLALDLERLLEGGLPGDGNYLSQGKQLFYGLCQRDDAVVLQQSERALPPLMLRLVDAYAVEGNTTIDEDEIALGRQTRLTTYGGAVLDFSWLALMGGGGGNLRLNEDGTVVVDAPMCDAPTLGGVECISAPDIVVAGDILSISPQFPSEETIDDLLAPANNDLLDAFVSAYRIASWDTTAALADPGSRRNVVQRLTNMAVMDFYLRFFDGAYGLRNKGVRVAMRPPFTSVLGNVCLPEDVAVCATVEAELVAAEARVAAGWRNQGFDIWVMYFLRHDEMGAYLPMADLAPSFSAFNGVVFDVNTNANPPGSPTTIAAGLTNAVRGASEEVGSLPVIFSPWAGQMSFYTEGEICTSAFGDYFTINEALFDAALTHFPFDQIKAFVIPLVDGSHFDIRDPHELVTGMGLNRVGETGFNNPLLNIYLSQ